MCAKREKELVQHRTIETMERLLLNKRKDELYCIYIMYGIGNKVGNYLTKHYIWVTASQIFYIYKGISR